MLTKVYPTSNNLSTPIETFDLAKLPYVVIALVSGFDYIHQHNENLINHSFTSYFSKLGRISA